MSDSVPPRAVLAGGADDVEVVAALAALAAVTGSGEVGRRLGGRGPAPLTGATPADPWTARARSAGPGGAHTSAAARSTHRWSRTTSHRT